MGAYAAPDDLEEDCSPEAVIESNLSSRKRTYPNAFVDAQRQDYDYRSSEEVRGEHAALPVVLDRSSHPVFPLGLTSGQLLERLRTSVAWIRYAILEYGGKFFSSGAPRITLQTGSYGVVGSWIDRKKTVSSGTQGPSPSKRQRVLPRQDNAQTRTSYYHDEPTETSPLLFSQQPQSRPPPRYPTLRPQRPQSQRGPALIKSSISPVEFPESFLSGAPYIESRTASLPQVPLRRHPPPSRKERFKNIASRLQCAPSSDKQQPSIPAGGAIRKIRAVRRAPYDRTVPKPKSSPQEAESRLAALERRAQTLQTSSQHLSLPNYKWGDEEVAAEFTRHYRRPSQRPSNHPTALLSSQPQKQETQKVTSENPPPFQFKFSTPMPTRFNFGGQFTSPPRSGVPEYVKKSTDSVPGIDKSLFRFEIPPPSVKKQEAAPSLTFKTSGVPLRDVTGGYQKTNAVPPKAKEKTATAPSVVIQSNRLPKSQSESSSAPNNNTFTILANSTPLKDKTLVQKTLRVKSEAITYHIQGPRSKKEASPAESNALPHSYPSTITTFDPSHPPPPVTPTHRRTTSAQTPTRSSRRAKITTTYAEDSHREFIRELRGILGQKKAKRDLEEREIDLQIAKLREEGQAVEGSLAGELPRLPELLARRVHEALFDTPDGAILVDNAFGKIMGKDIHKLQKGEWLNDEIINYYFAMIRTRSLNPSSVLSSKVKASKKRFPRIHTFSTYFFQLWSQRGYAGVRRWTKKAKVNVFELDRVLVPINKGGFHWVLGVINVEAERIEYYDSMGREGESADNRPYLTALRMFMVEEAKALGRDSEPASNWSFYVPVSSSPSPLRQLPHAFWLPLVFLPVLPVFLGVFGEEYLHVENAQTEEWVGLWRIHVCHGRAINRRTGQDELWTGSYGSIAGVYGRRNH